jgi:aryl-alcohol dehydrogenase-like predicted oxidoreductase
LVRQGKVRYVGASNFSSPWRLAEALLVSRYERLPSFVTYQPHFSLLYREELERWLLPLLLKYDVGILPWSPLEGGFLTGKYRRGQPLPDTERASRIAPLMTDHNLAVVAALDTIGRQHGWTTAQTALGWVLAQPWVTAPIIGANTPEQLKELLSAVDTRPTGDDLRQLNELTRWHRPTWWLENQ